MAAKTESTIAAFNDDELLRQYVSENDRDALKELIRRHAGIVYAAARRLVRRADLADDVSQAVFIALARRAGQIKSGAAIGAWLLAATRFHASNTMKSEIRRQRHENAAAQMREESMAQDPLERQWEVILPQLDEAIARLNLADQAAVVLRYFRGLSFWEVALATGTTEEGARKRVGRAIGRLREFLGASDEAMLGALLSSRGVEQMPGEVLSHVMAGTAGVQQVVGEPIAVGLMSMTASIKIGAIFVAVLLLLAAGYVVHLLAGTGSAHSSAMMAASQATTDPADEDDWQEKFREVYALDEGQNVKYVAPPFVPEREIFLKSSKKFQNSPPGKFEMFVYQDALGKFTHDAYLGWVFPGGPGANSQSFTDGALGLTHPGAASGIEIADLSAILARMPRIQVFEDPRLGAQIAPGDWVVRVGTKPIDIFKGIVSEWGRQTGQKLEIIEKAMPRDVIVVSGKARPQKPTEKQVDPSSLRHVHEFGRPWIFFPQRVRPKDMANWLSEFTGIFCIDETLSGPELSVQIDTPSPSFGNVMAGQSLDDLLKSLADQTGLTFKREQKIVDQWTITPVN